MFLNIELLLAVMTSYYIESKNIYFNFHEKVNFIERFQVHRYRRPLPCAPLSRRGRSIVPQGGPASR
jgi:hypothetical protein